MATMLVSFTNLLPSYCVTNTGCKMKSVRRLWWCWFTSASEVDCSFIIWTKPWSSAWILICTLLVLSGRLNLKRPISKKAVSKSNAHVEWRFKKKKKGSTWLFFLYKITSLLKLLDKKTNKQTWGATCRGSIQDWFGGVQDPKKMVDSWTFWTQKVDFLTLIPINPPTKIPCLVHFVAKSGPFGRFGGASHPTGLYSIINFSHSITCLPEVRPLKLDNEFPVSFF